MSSMQKMSIMHQSVLTLEEQIEVIEFNLLLINRDVNYTSIGTKYKLLESIDVNYASINQ